MCHSLIELQGNGENTVRVAKDILCPLLHLVCLRNSDGVWLLILCQSFLERPQTMIYQEIFNSLLSSLKSIFWSNVSSHPSF